MSQDQASPPVELASLHNGLLDLRDQLQTLVPRLEEWLQQRGPGDPRWYDLLEQMRAARFSYTQVGTGVSMIEDLNQLLGVQEARA